MHVHITIVDVVENTTNIIRKQDISEEDYRKLLMDINLTNILGNSNSSLGYMKTNKFYRIQGGEIKDTNTIASVIVW